MKTSNVPTSRIRQLNQQQPDPTAKFVLYWMIANRRLRYNFSLQRAIEWCIELGKPLVILEALGVGHRWANDRLHRFVLQGMYDNAASALKTKAQYCAFVERSRGEGAGFLADASKHAAIVVTDDHPCFIYPTLMKHASKAVGVQLEAVDSNGILPMRAASRIFPTAHGFRRFLQTELPTHLNEFPAADPLQGPFPAEQLDMSSLTAGWPSLSCDQLPNHCQDDQNFEIDHRVAPVETLGGYDAARATLDRFIEDRLPHYAERRNDPTDGAASGLSPYLHFGHLSAHEIFDALTRDSDWSVDDVATIKPNGKREKWWQLPPSIESFLDELITWRELGFNMCWQDPSYDQYDSLPTWALKTLDDHKADARAPSYDLDAFETAATHDPIWNAAQTQLLRDGRIHNYLRMLWGKKILHWSKSPVDALDTMIELNNKYALDGRDPNSYSGIFWCLGRYDRAWGPERPIFGKIRYMSSESTARKFSLKKYLALYQPE